MNNGISLLTGESIECIIVFDVMANARVKLPSDETSKAETSNSFQSAINFHQCIV